MKHVSEKSSFCLDRMNYQKDNLFVINLIIWVWVKEKKTDQITIGKNGMKSA